MHDGDADLAPPSRHGCGDLVARAVQQHIGFGIAEPQTPYMQVIEGRQHRRLEADLARSGIKLPPEARLRQPEDGGARPSLRRAHEDLKQRKSGKSIEDPGYAARAEQIDRSGGLQHASATGWRARDWQVAKSAMRSFLIAGLALLVFSGLGLCAESPDTSAPSSHPDLIIVRRFAAPRRIVVLDPSLGFSLQRGRQGVSPADRAASVARATAFIVADTVAQHLRDRGYKAVPSDAAGPEAGGRALIISGVFRSINEGHRRHFAAKDASVVVSVEIDTQTHGETPQRLKNFRLDSRQIPHESGRHREFGVNSAAMRLATMIAHAVAELAHRDDCAGCSRL